MERLSGKMNGSRDITFHQTVTKSFQAFQPRMLPVLDEWWKTRLQNSAEVALFTKRDVREIAPFIFRMRAWDAKKGVVLEKKKNRLSLPPSLWNNGMSKSRCVPDFPRTSILFREILGLNFNITVDRRSFLSAPGFSIIFSALALLKYFETAAALKRNLISSKVGIKSSLIVVDSYDISILSPFYRIFLKKNYSILLEDKGILAIIRTKFLIWSKSLKQVSRWKNSGKVSSFFEESRVHRGRSRWRRMFRR